MIIPVILAGGIGTRLWPVSRESLPKQFIKLLDEQSLFQKTLQRLGNLECAPAIVVGREDHRFIIAEQMRSIQAPCDTIILEPVGKNTAPAALLAAHYATEKYEDPILLILAADHVFSDIEGFKNCMNSAVELASSGAIVTFGADVTHPETGYGYIRKGTPIANTKGYAVERFVEKPDFQRAKSFYESKDYLFNCGMFMFKASSFISEMSYFEPNIEIAMLQALKNASVDQDFFRPDPVAFEQSPSESIDYAVMEKTKLAAVVPLEGNWNDVGSWQALAKEFEPDSNGNICSGDVVNIGASNCYLHSSNRLLAVSNVDDLVVIETDDAVMVMPKSQSQDVKMLVGHLKDNERKEIIESRRVSRPWGAYESLDSGERFLVKRITVSIGQRLSLQSHHHRSEHWVVVKGTARVTRGDEEFLLSENQSTYIPIGEKHRLENVGKIPLEIIEVQSGAYLGENDIVRYDDVYGRAELKTEA